MIKNFAKFWFYLLLLIFIGFALTGLYVLRYQPLVQFVVVVTASAFYFLVGVIYHLVKGDLTGQVVAEFAGMAIFVVLAFGILTFWRVI